MSIPIPGTYRIRSVPYPNQMFDLAGGSDKSDTPVAGYGNNHYNQNMLWTVQVVLATEAIVRLINAQSGTFAKPGSGIVGSPNPTEWKIVPRHNLGEYSIQTFDGKMACHLSNANNGEQVALRMVDKSESGQGWIFCPA